MMASKVFARVVQRDGGTVLVETGLPVFVTQLCRDIQPVLEANDALFDGLDMTVGDEPKEAFGRYKDDRWAGWAACSILDS